MKRIILTCLSCLAACSFAAAQDPETAVAQTAAEISAPETPLPKLRKKYLNIGFVNQKFKPADDYYFDTDQALKSNFGASLTVGRTYFLHKKPIARMIRFGIDATWFDLNYANYKLQYKYVGDYGGGYYDDYYGDEEESYSYHQAEIAMHAGPSVTVNPIDKLNVHAYFRYAPSFSILYADSFFGGYASYFVTGAAVSYNWIGLGVEARFGKPKLKEFGAGEDEGDYDYDYSYPTSFKAKFSGVRFYVTFRL